MSLVNQLVSSRVGVGLIGAAIGLIAYFLLYSRYYPGVPIVGPYHGIWVMLAAGAVGVFTTTTKHTHDTVPGLEEFVRALICSLIAWGLVGLLVLWFTNPSTRYIEAYMS